MTSTLQTTQDLVVHGELDDHLRLSALIAARVRDQEPSVDPALVDSCLDPTTRWSTKLDSVDRMLHDTGRTTRWRLVDIDGLWQGRRESIAVADVDLTADRHSFYEVLREHAQRWSWDMERPDPNPVVTRELGTGLVVSMAELFAVSSTGTPRSALDRALTRLPPVVRTVCRGTVLLGRVDARDLVDVLAVDHGSASPSDVMMELCYDALPADLKRTLWEVAIQRGPQAANGRLGELPWSEVVTHDRVERLVTSGWLVRTGNNAFMMHRRCRHFAMDRGRWRLEGGYRPRHVGLAESSDDAPLDVLLERHHHAIRGLDLERALATARHYGTDLRALSRNLSDDGRFEEAAACCRAILDRFDDEDAYAWEYLGYNLARAHDDPTPGVLGQIEAAYTRAVELDPTNPLYRGRLIGFMAQYRDLALDQMETHLGQFQEDELFGFAAKPLLDSLRRAGRESDFDALLDNWRPRLRAVPEILDAYPELGRQ